MFTTSPLATHCMYHHIAHANSLAKPLDSNCTYLYIYIYNSTQNNNKYIFRFTQPCTHPCQQYRRATERSIADMHASACLAPIHAPFDSIIGHWCTCDSVSTSKVAITSHNPTLALHWRNQRSSLSLCSHLSAGWPISFHYSVYTVLSTSLCSRPLCVVWSQQLQVVLWRRTPVWMVAQSNGSRRPLVHIPITKYKIIPNPNPNPNTKMTVNTIPKQM